METDVIQPFNPGDEFYEMVNRNLRAIAEMKPQIERAKSAGIDVTDQERQFNHWERTFTAVKKAYFPDRP